MLRPGLCWLVACSLGLVPEFAATAGELGELLHEASLHPQVQLAKTQVLAAQAQQDAASGRYLGSGALTGGVRKYEGLRTIGSYAPGTQPLPPLSDRLGVAGVSYSLPVDLFSAIKAGNERARHDLHAADLLERQQTLLKLHQTASAFITLQALLKQREALRISRLRIEAITAPAATRPCACASDSR
jgi:outer membrane protein TolC